MCFALGSYLTRERGKRVPRRHLEKLLWPTMRSDDASHSLSELIRKLRRKGVVIHRDEAACIWLPRDAVAIDIDLLSTEEPAKLAERDLSILPGYSPRASSAFNDWVDEWRDDLHLRLLDIVIAAAVRADAASDWPVALALAGKAIELDPHNEAALVVRAHAADHLARRDRETWRTSDQGAIVQTSTAQLYESASRANWPPRRIIAATADDTTLVGRDDTMDRLRAQAARALSGGVASAYVSAPAGIGKSRLVRELSSWIRGEGAVTCMVSCGNHDAQRPLSAFVQAVPRLQALPGAAGCAPSTLACLNRITHTSSDAAGTIAREETLYESASIRAAVIDLIDAISDEQPLLLVVEDVHWIDPASWALLRTIGTTANGSAMLLCTSRVKWKHTVWGEPHSFTVEHLSSLDRRSTRTHLCNQLARHGRSTDDQFIDWCVETSGGNPFFVEELVNFWVTTGDQYTAPPSLIALIETRLAGLKPDALRVIQAAAILGKNSTLELLQRVLEFPTHVLFASIEALAESGMLSVGDDATGAASVHCRHDTVLRAATRGLSPHGRALLHHAAASALEAVAATTGSAELFWDCADHWQAAGQPDRSTGAAIACARHLHDMGLVEEAIARCKAALATCQSDASRTIVLRTMAQSQYAANDWAAFCDTSIQVRRLESHASSGATIHDDLELCELNAEYSLRRDWPGALERTLRCVHSCAADASHKVQAAVNALIIASNVGDFDTMDAVYTTAASLLYWPGVGNQDRLKLTMIYESIRGDSARGAEAARELLLLAERTLSERHRLPIMLNCASALRRGGVAGESEAVCETLFELAVNFGCYGVAAQACNRLIEMHGDAGRIATASEWVVRYRRLRRPKAELKSQRSLRIAIARVHLWKHEWDAASKLLAPAGSRPLWEDKVRLLRSAAIATKIRLDIGRGASQGDIARWVTNLAMLSDEFRTTGAQDYECYSLYLGHRYMGNTEAGGKLLDHYVRFERRDSKLLAPEIVVELSRLNLGL